ncbi:MAG: NADH-quinone oxidoreductase subunit H, partial [Candidatus Marinimicrobia bacterium]|nr:NADH-quinone oxidoreductase subunit H [Candidatus Neomarinimicrobiota bacterium]
MIVIGGTFTAVAYLILAERKVAGFVQERYGPNRVGIWGLLQPIADGVKTMLKEDITPAKANRIIYHLAPAMV